MLESNFETGGALKIRADREYPGNMSHVRGGLRSSETADLPNPQAEACRRVVGGQEKGPTSSETDLCQMLYWTLGVILHLILYQAN